MDRLQNCSTTEHMKQPGCYLQLFLTADQFLFNTKAITKLIKLCIIKGLLNNLQKTVQQGIGVFIRLCFVRSLVRI